MEVLILERMGQLVSEGVLELIPSLDQPRHDDDPVAAIVECAADPVEPALGVGPEAELGRQESRELVEVDAGALQATSQPKARRARPARLRSRRASLRPSAVRRRGPISVSSEGRNSRPRIRSTRAATCRSCGSRRASTRA